MPEAARDERGQLVGTIFDSYDMDLDRVVAELKARHAAKPMKLIGIQLPDGMRDYGTDVADRLEKAVGVECIVSADPSYGACDLALNLEKWVDVLVHFGHTEMPSITGLYKMDVIFVPARHRSDVNEAVLLGAREAERAYGAKRIGLVTTAQHAHKLTDACAALEAAGFIPIVGRGDNRLSTPGQLLGCNYTAGASIDALVDAFVYIGSGDFHPIAIRWGTKKPVILADPYTNEVRRLEEKMDRLMRQRFAAITRAEGAQHFGILVGLRVGQERMKLAKGLKHMLEAKGKKATLIALDFFSWDNLQYFRHLDCLVNTSCPRITTDDYSRYPMPMLTPPELEIVLGRRTWEQYVFDEFRGTTAVPKGPQAVAIGKVPE